MSNALSDGSAPRDQETDFGYRRVREDEKDRLVRGVFDNVARRYDLMNDLMSFGVHRLWKRATLDTLGLRAGENLLDVAGGTGDIAHGAVQRLTQRDLEPGLVTICDKTPAMLSVGRDRLLDQGRHDQVCWVAGDAEALPVPDRSMDACTIAFGLRNVTRPQMALNEMRRVLKPGGRFFCLEFSHVVLPLLDRIYDQWSFHVIPRIGEVVLRDRASYEYLVESIRRFPTQENLAGMMAQAGMSRVRWRNMSGGIVALHSGWRL